MSAVIDHPGFLADIIDHPEEDVPRLAYADWLEEQDQGERAQFIRIQCELWRRFGPRLAEWRRLLKGAPQAVPADAQKLFLAEKVLSRLVTRQWYLPRQVYQDSRVWMDVARGFLVRVGLTLEHWRQVGPWLVRRQPLQSVHLVDRAPSVPEEAEWVSAWWGCPQRELFTATWNESALTHAIPAPIFKHLSGVRHPATFHPNRPAEAIYRGTHPQDCVHQAQADLSQACLRWAKEHACPQ